MVITEENLVEQLQHKNSKSLDFLVDMYGTLLYKVIYSILGTYPDKGILDECLNDVFLSIWNHINSFSGESDKFVNWICSVAKYRAIDYRRKYSKSKDNLNIDDCAIASNTEIEDEILTEETRKELLKHIKQMDMIDKKIFIMRYYLDEPVLKIAEKLGVSRDVIDKRLSRGRKLLKQKMNSFNEEEGNNERSVHVL
jgi:RNA polymerase sigma factor, sigma-70 family